MQLPNVLIIGAMKAGTTSLYMDLTSHPQVFRAESKEPHALCDAAVLTDSGRRAYQSLYFGAKPDQLIVDASTGYSKLPDYPDVARRASLLLPPDFKVVYVVRHPIDRIVSQHHHEFTAQIVGPSFNEEVRRHSRYVDFSRYAYQLIPWLEVVGRERIHVVKFEDYVDQRENVLERLCEFLGLDHQQLASAGARVYNKSDRKPIRNKFWDAVFHNPAYRHALRRMLSPRLRITLMQWLLPKGSLRPDPPGPETIAWLRGTLEDDFSRLQEILGDAAPTWPNFSPQLRFISNSTRAV